MRPWLEGKAGLGECARLALGRLFMLSTPGSGTSYSHPPRVSKGGWWHGTLEPQAVSHPSPPRPAGAAPRRPVVPYEDPCPITAQSAGSHPSPGASQSDKPCHAVSQWPEGTRTRAAGGGGAIGCGLGGAARGAPALFRGPRARRAVFGVGLAPRAPAGGGESGGLALGPLLLSAGSVTRALRGRGAPRDPWGGDGKALPESRPPRSAPAWGSANEAV